jgi:3-deoxy-7-phosphoheptulonate synthase
MHDNLKLYDTNVIGYTDIISPNEVKKKYPATEEIHDNVSTFRNEITNIISGKSDKKLLIVGPCSIHDKKAALEYAQKLKHLANEVSDTFFIVMRVYFEKPRTVIGWKGLISDPHLDESYDLNRGYSLAREIMVAISEIGLPIATELLDPITPQYIDDLTSWVAIGARTIESQIHRQMASGLSIPTGFKNATSGYSDVAINAMLAAREPSSFAGINHDGKISNILTKGNPHVHLILRGGRDGPNYTEDDIIVISKELEKNKLHTNIMVDCSHANSEKNYRKQGDVLRTTIENMKQHKNIIGAMLESHLFEGKQALPNHLNGFKASTLQYGVSITDACIGWDETEKLIKEAHSQLPKNE